VGRKDKEKYNIDKFVYPKTEGFMMAIQNGVIKTRNYLKYIIKEDTVQEGQCCMYGKIGKKIQHISGGTL